MKFRINEDSSIPIYEQIANNIIEMIVFGYYMEEKRIPSVRELSAHLKVNPNTVAHTYKHLSSKNIIYSKRGMGYFVKKGAGKYCRELLIERVSEKIQTEVQVLKRAGISEEKIKEILDRIGGA